MRFSDRQRPVEITARHLVRVNESNAHLAAGLAGLGVIQTFSFIARPAVDRGELVPVLARFQPPPYEFHLAYPPNRYVSNASACSSIGPRSSSEGSRDRGLDDMSSPRRSAPMTYCGRQEGQPETSNARRAVQERRILKCSPARLLRSERLPRASRVIRLLEQRRALRGENEESWHPSAGKHE